MIKRRPWPLLSPQAILIITLATAAAVFLGGLYLARHDEQVHLPANRKPIQLIGEEMEKKSAQLERLYEKDLRHLILSTLTWTDDPLKIAELCHSIVGVEQWSLIHARTVSGGDMHVAADPSSTTSWPRPTFKTEGLGHDDLLLSRDDLFQADGQTWGWIADPGKPLLFWQRADTTNDAVAVLLIVPGSLHVALNTWFAQWAQEAFAPLRMRNGPLCALESSDTVLMSTGITPSTAPDFILPIRSSLGSWEIVAWDRIITLTTYDFRTLNIAGFLTLLIVLLGVIAYLQQKQLLARTAQRVTFVNRVSHELRSPLTNILLNLELTREMLGDEEDPPIRRLGLVQEEAHRLRRLVDNVLTFSSLEQGKPRLTSHTCVPDQIIQSVIHQFAPSFARRGLLVDYRGDIASPCLLDVDAVTQILSNLFSNIEKYVPGGTVTITAHFQADFLVVRVADEGPGIPVREAARIFKPFERLDGRINEGATGTGLGLSIAQELALGLGGTLRLVPGKVGATFELRVPASSLLHPTA